MSNGSDLAETIRTGQEPSRPKSALAESLRKELHPEGPPAQVGSLADQLRGDLKRGGFKHEEEPPNLFDRLVQGFVVEPLKDVSRWVRVNLMTGGFGGPLDPERITQAATGMTHEELRGAKRGEALVLSFAGAPLVGGVAGPLLGKWGSFAVGEFLGGGIYGATRPLEDEESRTSAVLGDAATFATLGVATKYAVVPAMKRFILRMPDAKRRIALGMARAGLDRIETDLSHGGVMLDQLPPEAKARLEEQVLRHAVQVADPSAIDIDAIAKQEADRELEIHSRVTPDKPSLRLPDVEQEFKEQVAKAKPLHELTDEELAAVHPLGATPPFEESAAGPAAREPRAERRVAEHPVDIERRRSLESMKEKVAQLRREGYGENAKLLQLQVDRMEPTTGPVASLRPGGTLYAPGTVDVMKKAIDASGGPQAFRKLVADKAAAAGRTIDGSYVEEVARNVVQESQSRAQLREHIVAPTVRGKSGKLYVGGSTHQETIDRAIKAGAPASEFAEAGPAGAARGFKTSARDFASREEAAGLIGHGEPLVSEDLHKRGLTPLESPDVAEMNLENVAREAMKPGAKPPPEAVMDAALDHAVASTKPLDAAAPSVKTDAALVQQEIHALPERGADESQRLQGIIAAALDRGDEAEKTVTLNLTEPTPVQISEERVKARTPHEQNRHRGSLELKRSLTREQAPISVGAEEQVSEKPPTDDEMVVPKKIDGLQIAVNLKDKQLDDLAKVLRDQRGEITATMLAKMAAFGVGSWAEWEGLTDERLTAGERAGLVAVGGFLIGAAVYDRLSESIAKGLPERLAKLRPMAKLVKNVITAYNPVKMMNDYPQGKEAFRQYVEMLMSWKQDAYDHGLVMDKMYPDEASNRAAMFVADEGRAAPEFNSLTPAQQQHAMNLNAFNLRLGILGKAAGILDDFRENYIRHLLPADAFERWKTSGFHVLPTSGAFAKKRIFSLRELEAWAAKNGLPGPIMKVSTVHAYHLGEFSRALAGVRLRDELERVALIGNMPKSSLTPIPKGWRPIKGVLNLPDKIAPDPIAKAIESISSPRSSRSEIVNAMEGVKSLWMRSIMFWWWEHGFNVARSWINLSMNPADYANTYRFMRGVDGLDAQIARHGGNLHDRPDRAAFALEQARKLFDAVGLQKLGGKYAKFAEMEDKLLWDKVVPSLQRFSYAMNMHKWTERTGGKFLEGSPEFTAAARNAADFANTISGRVPTLLQDPALASGMRLMMFSPQWTMSRMSLLANAAGEANEILNGRISNKDPLYIKFKLRQLFWGGVITAVGSKLMSGKWPQFNPQTTKFYMRTGLHNSNGQEIGLDVIGWWQDDIKLLNSPFNYIGTRLNPALRIAQETIDGRDYLGRAMTPGQKIGNILTSFGPLPEVAADAYRVAQAASGGRPIRGAEGIQMASRALATFRTATLPRPIDAVVGKFAKKLLLKQGIPAADENIYELSKLLRSNLLANKDLIDSRVVYFLASRRRGEIIKHPAATAIWQEARRVLADF